MSIRYLTRRLQLDRTGKPKLTYPVSVRFDKDFMGAALATGLRELLMPRRRAAIRPVKGERWSLGLAATGAVEPAVQRRSGVPAEHRIIPRFAPEKSDRNEIRGRPVCQLVTCAAGARVNPHGLGADRPVVVSSSGGRG